MNIVITGGTRGIGKGMVEYFLMNNHNVTFSGTSIQSINEALNDVKGNFHAVICDVSKPKDIEKLYFEAVEQFGHVDVWFNNAGVNQRRGEVSELLYTDIDHVIDINVKGMMYATSFVVSKMKEVGVGIVYNMEGLGSDGRMIPETILYASSKRLLRYFSQGADKELKGTNVRVGTVSPGMVFTDLLMSETSDDAKKVINILADDVDTVTTYICKKIELGKKKINWLTNRKVMKKFILSAFKKHN